LPLYLPLYGQMKLRGQFQITEFENPNKSISWRVTGTKPDGERVRENYKTEAEALGRKQALEIEASNFEPDHRIATTRLSPQQVATAESVFRRIEEKKFPLSLDQIVEYAFKNYREPVKQITLKDALNEFIKERKATNDRPLTIRNLEQRIGGIVDHQPEKQLAEVTEVEIKALISKPGRGPVTRNNERRVFLQFFNWASEKGYCAINPVTPIETVKIDREEPQILPLPKVRALLSAARSYKDGAVLPYVALSLFAGIRPAELARLSSWSNIKLDRGTITIGAEAAKLRARRVIELPKLDGESNLAEWLEPHLLKKKPIVGKNWRKDLDRVKEIAGLVTRETAKSATKKPKKKKGRIVQARRYWKKLIPVCWCPDILRHTAISNHFAWCQHEGQTASWAGNSPDMIHRHYKGLVDSADAKEFWSIVPNDKILNLPGSALASLKQA
jgi:integrase